MDRYVDGYVLPVPADRVEEYREMAAEAGEFWIEQGALEFFEGVGEDMTPEVAGASMRTFPDLAGAGEDEAVVFAYVVYESREHRDEVNGRVMDAMDAEAHDGDMPFDTDRMAYGGFRTLVSYER